MWAQRAPRQTKESAFGRVTYTGTKADQHRVYTSYVGMYYVFINVVEVSLCAWGSFKNEATIREREKWKPRCLHARMHSQRKAASNISKKNEKQTHKQAYRQIDKACKVRSHYGYTFVQVIVPINGIPLRKNWNSEKEENECQTTVERVSRLAACKQANKQTNK